MGAKGSEAKISTRVNYLRRALIPACPRSTTFRVPTRSTQQRLPKGERRRRALLDALASLLEDRPLADVQVADITTAAGLARSAFYFYYPTKHAVVIDLMDDVFDEMMQTAQGYMTGGEDVARIMHEGFLALVTVWDKNARLVAAMLDARDADPEAARIWLAWVDSFVPPLVEAAERANPERAVSTELLVRMLLQMNGAMLERHVRKIEPQYSKAALAEAMAEIWVGALFRPA